MTKEMEDYPAILSNGPIQAYVITSFHYIKNHNAHNISPIMRVTCIIIIANERQRWTPEGEKSWEPL